MVASSIGLITLTALAAFTSYTGRSFIAMGNYVDLDRASRNALDYMTKDIRQTQRLNAYATNRLDFLDQDGAILSYIYDSGNRTLTRSLGSTNKVLLTECDELQFSIFQRNPVGGTYDQYPTATVTNTKLVQVTWTCSRKIIGAKVNTESVQTAKIVIRKH
jgi:hypothetical protein